MPPNAASAAVAAAATGHNKRCHGKHNQQIVRLTIFFVLLVLLLVCLFPLAAFDFFAPPPSWVGIPRGENVKQPTHPSPPVSRTSLPPIRLPLLCPAGLGGAGAVPRRGGAQTLSWLASPADRHKTATNPNTTHTRPLACVDSVQRPKHCFRSLSIAKNTQSAAEDVWYRCPALLRWSHPPCHWSSGRQEVWLSPQRVWRCPDSTFGAPQVDFSHGFPVSRCLPIL